MSLLRFDPEPYYPRHASLPPDAPRITADYRPARFDPLVSVARQAFGSPMPFNPEFDSSRYERPLPPPCLRVGA